MTITVHTFRVDGQPMRNSTVQWYLRDIEMRRIKRDALTPGTQEWRNENGSMLCSQIVLDDMLRRLGMEGLQ